MIYGFYFFQQNQDKQGEIDINPATILEKIDSWVDGFMKLLPNLGVALALLIIGYFVSKWIGRFITKRITRKDRPNLGEMLGGLLRWLIFLVIISLAVTIVLPTVKPGDLIAGLGVSSVAIGFAFQDILQNWLAGLLILIRQPFEIGDQIEINGYEGTVEKIETRATIIETYAGERIVIPNNDIYTNAVKVKTAHKIRRSQYDVGIGYGDDMEKTIEVLKKALEKIEGVNNEKGVEVFVWDLAASWVTLRVRWWTESHRAAVVKTMVKVIPTIKKVCDENGIDMPYETQVQLWHDQTEARDGIRGKQREGWPSPADGQTKPARIQELDYKAEKEFKKDNKAE